MKKINYFGIVVLIVLLIGVAFWWATSGVKDRKHPLNSSDAFVYSDNGILYWFELTSRNGKVDGKFHQLEIKEEIGKEPLMQGMQFPLTGEKTDKGYEFEINHDGTSMIFEAWLSDANLIVQKQGEQDNKLYKAVSKEELDEFVDAIQEELQVVIDQAESKEKDRLNNFFSELDRIYGYLYTNKDETYQLFLKIDEALHQGELTGSLLVMAYPENASNSYEESRFVLYGISDGLMVEFFTTVDGKDTKLEGNFHENATSFDLSFWMTEPKITFHAVTEEEFDQSYREFKTE